MFLKCKPRSSARQKAYWYFGEPQHNPELESLLLSSNGCIICPYMSVLSRGTSGYPCIQSRSTITTPTRYADVSNFAKEAHALQYSTYSPSPDLLARERVQRARERPRDAIAALDEQRQEGPLLLPSGQEAERIAAKRFLEGLWGSA